MRRKIFVSACLTVFVTVLFAADAPQPLNIKPGEWHVQLNDIKYSGLPPQYQAMFDQMTAQQKSAMGLGAPEKLCVKAADLNKAWLQDTCHWTTLKSTSSDLETRSTSCKHGSRGANSDDMDMNLKIHAVDSEHIRMTLHATATMQGSPVTIDGSYLGKWLGSTCSAKD